jgi:DNA repair protein RadC
MNKTELYKLIRCGNYNEAAFLLLEHASPYGMKVSSPSEAYPILRKYGAKRQEHFIALLLNGAHEVIKEEIISIGIANRTVVHPREVYYPAILHNSVAILVAHNHPSGRVDPSVALPGFGWS